MSAKSIIKFCGGRIALSRAIGVPVKTIANWTRSKATKGCGDIVPERYRDRILAQFPALDYSNFQPMAEAQNESDI